jgi:F-type H+-transporting ATPase subunit b
MWKRVSTRLFAVAIGLAVASPIFASESAAADDGGMNPFSLSAWQSDLALWTAVVFLCLVAILWKDAWGPLAAGLDKREHSIVDRIAQAEAANQKAKDILAEYEQKLAAAGDDVRAIVEQGRRNAEKLGQTLIEKAKKDAEAEYQKSLKQIDAATAAAIKELAGQSAAMAVELAGKIVQSKLSPKDHSRLIQDAVAGFTQSKN